MTAATVAFAYFKNKEVIAGAFFDGMRDMFRIRDNVLPERQIMRFLRKSLVGVFLLALTLALFAWAGNTVRGAVQARMNEEPRSFGQRERVFATNVVVVEPQNIIPVLTTFGEVQSRRSTSLRAPVGGVVLQASDALVEGGQVAQGDLLVQLDPATAQSARDRVAADVQDAEGNLRDADRQVVLARDELTSAEGQAALRAQALTRAQDLQRRGVGTTASVETAELASSTADATVLSRRQAVDNALAAVDQAQTALARAKINLADAERDLADTSVHAPFNGTLSDVAVALGGRLSANEAFATLLDPTQLEVGFRVSTTQYARLLDENGSLRNALVEVSIDNLKTTGRITRESAAVGEGQTGRLLFATLDDAPAFRPGDFVTVAVEEPELRRVALIPATALAADETVLTVTDDNRLRSIDTELLRRQGDDVIIAVRGLAGQKIVAERSPLLGDGISVRPIVSGAEPEPPKVVTLDSDRRAKLVAFVTNSRMPDPVKARTLRQLEQEEVPADVVERIESRMGG